MRAVRQAMGWHRALMCFAGSMLVTGVVSAVEYNVDDRVMAGVPIWAKPLLFSISFQLYAITLAWLISQLRRPRVRRFAHRAGTVIAVSTGLEMLAIVVQVVRGQQSHFNYSSRFNAAVFAAMGAFVVIIFCATIAVGVALLRESPPADRVTTLAVRLGLGISIAGMAVGFLMVIPRPSQHGALIRGAHSVGVADGGPSVPLVGWSTRGGDLRIPHFVGLHALQALPLIAVALTLVPATAALAERTRTRLVLIGAGGYTGLFALVLWQALRGQPITAPDRWTMVGLAGLLIAVGVAGAIGLRGDERCLRTEEPTATPKSHRTSTPIPAAANR